MYDKDAAIEGGEGGGAKITCMTHGRKGEREGALLAERECKRVWDNVEGRIQCRRRSCRR